MIIYAIYIIDYNGKTMFSEYFQTSEGIPDEQLVGALMTALQAFTAEVTENESEMKTIEAEGFSYHIRSFGLFRIVLVTDLPKSPEDIIQTLGIRFMKEFGDQITDKWSIPSIFSTFKTTTHEILGAVITDQSKSIKPTKILTTDEIFNLPHPLHSTALAIVAIQEGTIEEIATEAKLGVSKASDNIEDLASRGFIGTKKREEETTYFCQV